MASVILKIELERPVSCLRGVCEREREGGRRREWGNVVALLSAPTQLFIENIRNLFDIKYVFACVVYYLSNAHSLHALCMYDVGFLCKGNHTDIVKEKLSRDWDKARNAEGGGRDKAMRKREGGG